MNISPQVRHIAQAFEHLHHENPQRALDLQATLLWLLASSEECQRTMHQIDPTPEELKDLCNHLGPLGRAWVQFSPEACDRLRKAPD